MIGSGERTRKAAADVAISASPDFVIKALSQALEEGASSGASEAVLSDDGFAISVVPDRTAGGHLRLHH